MRREKGGNAATSAKAPSFLSSCVAELQKVVRPTKDETIQATTVTIFILIFVALVLWLFDVIWGRGATLLFESLEKFL